MAEPLLKQQRSASNVAEFSVSELSAAIKRALEDGFGYVRVRGEISGYRGPHSSGHAYFALKDERSKIDAVIWKGTFGRLRFRPEEGMEVVAQGRLTTYPGSSKYQIVIEMLEPAGAGALMAVLEERKKKLAAEGLFSEERKRKLPFLPRAVGVITSPTGAVIRDMLHGFNERFPMHVMVWPVRVQGETCAAEVAAAIRGFNAVAAGGNVPRPDVIIVARGGGSLEDLWGFNEEIVVRAAAESAIPLISAVGHETDWTLIDLVADARAPTPTKAAEWAVPKHSELVETGEKLSLRIRTAVRRVVDGMRTHLKAAARGLPRPEDLVALPRQRFDATDRRLGRALLANTRAHGVRHARLASRLHPRLLSIRLQQSGDRLEALHRRSADALARLTGARRARFERTAGRLIPEVIRGRIERCDERLQNLHDRAGRALAHRIGRQRHLLESAAGLLRSLSYQSVLRRGFALVRDASGASIRSTGQVQSGAALSIEVADGSFSAVVTDGGKSGRTGESSGETRESQGEKLQTAPKRSRDPGGSQGSLF
ncbi:MAG: exodeoxyribonuclease VII large subunit [Hyphomicrobiaceae bacterium]